jgi:putative membrane protein
MNDFVARHYDLWRALHIISVIAWMAGIMYLPRLYAYHVKHGPASAVGKVFEGMEHKLLRIIMNPAMVLTWTFGVLLIWANYENRGAETFQTPWFLTKLAGIVFVTYWHHVLSSARKKIVAGTDKRSETFWRATNELPFLAAIVMVIAVTTEFGG